jgi:hypothetical protein
MKIRTGFVSNSSSSSFTCEISGETVSSATGEYYEGYMCECSKGHAFVPKYELKNKAKTIEDKRDFCLMIDEYYCDKIEFDEDEEEILENIKKASDKQIEELYDKHEKEIMSLISEESEYGIRNVPMFRCPLCNFEKISKDNLLKYMRKKFFDGKKISEIEKLIIKEFDGNLAEFEKFIGDKK